MGGWMDYMPYWWLQITISYDNWLRGDVFLILLHEFYGKPWNSILSLLIPSWKIDLFERR